MAAAIGDAAHEHDDEEDDHGSKRELEGDGDGEGGGDGLEAVEAELRSGMEENMSLGTTRVGEGGSRGRRVSFPGEANLSVSVESVGGGRMDDSTSGVGRIESGGGKGGAHEEVVVNEQLIKTPPMHSPDRAARNWGSARKVVSTQK